AELVNRDNGQAKTEASRQTDKQLPSTGEKTNRGLFVTGLLSILSLGFLRKRRTK
ncbi:MAG: LPXTG cell wall anchor domain-containing protein, partial [Streptococcus salivarius]